MKVKIICQNCNKEFYTIPPRSKSKFCNRSCYGEYKSKYHRGANSSNWKGGKVKRNCMFCNKEIFIDIHEVEKGYGRFCSKICQGKYQSEHCIGIKSANWKGGKKKVVCIFCSKEFHVYKYRTNNTKFCSNVCKGKYQSKNMVNENNPNWKGGPKKINCISCNKEFLSQNKDAMFCGRKCYHKYWGEKYKGKNNPNWLGGISFEPYPIEWNKALKKKIRERDNHTCQNCHKFGNHVHHIDYDKKNCLEDNLITLCHSCHMKTNGNREHWKKELGIVNSREV